MIKAVFQNPEDHRRRIALEPEISFGANKQVMFFAGGSEPSLLMRRYQNVATLFLIIGYGITDRTPQVVEFVARHAHALDDVNPPVRVFGRMVNGFVPYLRVFID